MNQSALFQGPETFVLAQLEMYNWGGFQKCHKATVDPAGTAVIGATGSGKTTLVDALMTLLCANPRYNLASTGGHESDRDLVSYVRGVSGPGDGGGGQSHIARQGKTVTAIVATLQSQTRQIRLGALLWFDDSSSAATDMKKLWLFSEAPEHTLEHWLGIHHDGGMRALCQMEKEGSGIWTYPRKKSYLARLRDYFEVGENAFTLLNRAAGLKQLNSIDEIFRELVLDDRSAFERAAEVANSFDDLTEIHQELETARKQQRSLQPIAEGWERYQANQRQLIDIQQLNVLLPVWFAEQAYHLWLTQAKQLQGDYEHAQHRTSTLDEQVQVQKTRVDEQRQRYLQVGGAGIDELKARIGEWGKNVAKRQSQAAQYQRLAVNLGLSDALTQAALLANQQEVGKRLMVLADEIQEAQEHEFHLRSAERDLKAQLNTLEQEKSEVERRPGSNLEPRFQTFRADLAAELALDESALPFVAELVQVNAQEQTWRGAIERAVGGHRLRILVPPSSVPAALRWVNQRYNRLHVRLLEVKNPVSQPMFFEDSYSHKLTYKDHPYREAVRALLAANDRHCVDNPEQLRLMPHAMTALGLMSGRTHFFDKQDQKRLDEDWLTGFDNRDRLARLVTQIQQLTGQVSHAEQAFRTAQSGVTQLQEKSRAFEQLQSVDFEDIDLLDAQHQLEALRERLETLTLPDSDIATAKALLEELEALQKKLEHQHRQALEVSVGLKKELERAVECQRKYYRGAEQGMTDAQRALGDRHFPQLTSKHRDELPELERECSRKMQLQIDDLKERLKSQELDLSKRMSDAKKEDQGALSEVGRELEDIPRYLERLRVLTEEALPEKLRRFLDYLNRSSDEGVTQLLSHIDHEVSIIEERLEDLNKTMRKVDFQPSHYLQLVARKVVHESVRTLQRAQRQLASSRFADDAGESQYRALNALVLLLKDACERNRTQGAKALLDPRFRLEFAVSVIDRESGGIIETRTGSQGGSGGEKEIIASYVLTASLSYALCPDGSSLPLFGTIVLDEAFSRTSPGVAGRIIAALKAFGLHAIFITPNKEMRLLRHHTRSAIVVHRRAMASSLASLSWEALDEHYQRRNQKPE